MNDIITITTDEYKNLIEDKMKYDFLMQMILDTSSLDTKGKIDFSYALDDKFDTFMKSFEQDRYFVFKELNQKEREENEDA